MHSQNTRAQVDWSLWLIGSVIASLSYFVARDGDLPDRVMTIWKGAGVGLLAVHAARQAASTNGWLLALSLALAAGGDIALETDMLTGGLLFALGHTAAIALFLRNRREGTTGSQRLAGIALLVGTPLVAAMLAAADPRWPLAAAYAAIVGGMAAAAWISRFPRYRVGVGAVLFVASDLLLFAREGQHVSQAVAWWTIWPLYYTGQFLIATGVARTLRTARAEPAPSN